MSISLSFPKKDRLKSQKAIAFLFENGKSYFKYPIKVIYFQQATKEKSPIKAAFTAPKKRYPSAVDRNLLKRRMREAYRINKIDLVQQLTEKDLSLICMFIYIGKEINSFDKIENAIKHATKYLSKNSG